MSGIVHTHGAYSEFYNGENFSTEDIDNAKKHKVPMYLVTPRGKMKKYNPATKITHTINSAMPRDWRYHK